MATFGLVHGAWHGAWCWDRLVPELEARGHLGVDSVELEGGHSPFLSRPAELAEALIRVA
jgi:hypothetical protein